MKKSVKKTVKVVKKSFKKKTFKPNKGVNKSFTFKNFAPKIPFPMRMLTTLSCNASGYIATAGARSSYGLSVPGAGIYLPFNTKSSYPTSSGFPTVVTQLTGATSFATIQCTGYNQLNSLYKQFRVIGSKIKVTIFPVVAGDTVNVALLPSTQENQINVGFSGASGGVNPLPAQASTYPYSKMKVCDRESSPKACTLTSFMSTAKINALSASQYKNDVVNGVGIASDPNVTVGAQSEDLPWLWWISLQSADNDVFAGNMLVNVTITYYVELTNPTVSGN